MVEATWFARDRPVLDAIVTYFEEEGGRSFPQLSDISTITSLDVEDVSRAAQALDGAFIDLQRTSAPPGHWHVNRVYPAARAATGQWPTAESLAAEIIAGLEQSAEQEQDAAKQGRMREAAAVLGSAARDVTTSVLAAVILRSTGMG